MSTHDSLRGSKWEAYHWPPSNAKVKNFWAFTSIPLYIWECIQKFPDWPPRTRAANGTALCHYVQLYHCFVSQSSEFCRHNPLCCFSANVYCCCLFRYRLNPENFGYTLVFMVWCLSIRIYFQCTQFRERFIFQVFWGPPSLLSKGYQALFPWG
jgi:hypothetical protein